MRNAYIFLGCCVLGSVAPGCQRSPVAAAPAPAAADQEFAPAVDGIWNDAGIGSDADYRALFPGAPNKIAPRDLRERVASWPNAKVVSRRLANLRLTCQGERVSFFWDAELRLPGDDVAAREWLNATFLKQGYRLVSDKSEIEPLAARLELDPHQLADLLAERSYGRIHVRQAGETELLVHSEPAPTTGSAAYTCGVKLTWLTSRPYPHPSPTLAHVVAALPVWAHAPYLDPALRAAVVDEPITGYGAGDGVAITFPANVRERLETALRSSGFEFYEETEPLQNGSVQYMWYRHADATWSHIMTSPKHTRTQFSFQRPQHDSKTVRPPPPARHPSLRLPVSKRPQVDVTQIPLSNPELKRQTEWFCDLAERIAADNWIVAPLTDLRHSGAPRFVSKWQTADVRRIDVLRRDLPYHGLEIELSGPDSKGDPDQVNALQVNGRWIPETGWAAWMQYSRQPAGAGQSVDHLSYAMVSLVLKSDFPVDVRYGQTALCLTRQVVDVSTRNKLESYYRFSTHAAPDAADERRHCLALYESPESLRETMLRQLAALRERAQRQIPLLEGMEYVDMSGVRSDNPPQPVPAEFSPPQATTRQALLDQVLTEIERRETMVREHCEPMHAAIVKALPIGEFLNSLAVDQ